MTILWNRNWDRIDAVLNLCFDGAKTNLDGNIKSRLRISVTAAFNKLPARLINDPDLGEQGSVLAEAIAKIRNTMSTLKLIETKVLPVVLWIRLLNQAEIEITDTAISLFGRWMIEQGTKNILLMQNKKRETGEWGGLKIEIEGNKTIRGYTIMEMLFLKRGNKGTWPFKLLWRMELIDTIANKDTVLKVESPHQATKEKQKRSDSKTTIQKPVRKTRRSLDEIKKCCGTGLVDELERCIREEAKKADSSLLGTLGKDKRYTSSHSLEKLIIRLQARYQTLKKLKASTLKSALSAFVSCPRGRPKSKIEVKEQGGKRPIR